MLVNLHVKNLALIEEENIDFDEGLNILSGETGAGKSIICLLYTSPSPRDVEESRMPSSA